LLSAHQYCDHLSFLAEVLTHTWSFKHILNMVLNSLRIWLTVTVCIALVESAMNANGALCQLIKATNLPELANYGWDCSNEDCSDATTFALTPPSKGICDGGELVEIRLGNTNNVAALQGTIPDVFGEISTPLRSLQLQTNKMFGSIPFNMGQIHTTLSYFDISNNKLTGTIPSSFCDIAALTTLKFGSNDDLFCYAHCLSSLADLSPGTVAQCGECGMHIFIFKCC
jgi:hypothetical protein